MIAALGGGALAIAGALIGALVTVWLGPKYLLRLQRSGKVRYRVSDLVWDEKLKFYEVRQPFIRNSSLLVSVVGLYIRVGAKRMEMRTKPE